MVLLLRFLFVSMVMGVIVRLLACLPIRVSLCFFGWLDVGVYVCLCVFNHFAAHFHVLFAVCEAFFGFSCTSGGPATPL